MVGIYAGLITLTVYLLCLLLKKKPFPEIKNPLIVTISSGVFMNSILTGSEILFHELNHTLSIEHIFSIVIGSLVLCFITGRETYELFINDIFKK